MPEGHAMVKSTKGRSAAAKATEKWLRKAYREHGSTEGDQLELRRRRATTGIKAMEAFISEIESAHKNAKDLTPEQDMALRKTLFDMTARYWECELLSQLVDNLSARFVAKGRHTKKKGYVRIPSSLYFDNIWNELAHIRAAMERIAEMPDDEGAGGEEEPLEADDADIYDEQEEEPKKK